MMNEDQNNVLQMLQERIKEQSCLYKISSLDEQALSIEKLLSEAVSILPGGWQHPEQTAASIEYNGTRYTTPRFRETQWKMSAEADVRKEKFLVINVVYLESKPVCDEGPFLKEERNLINSVINHLALKVNRIISQQELIEKQELLDKAYRLA